MDTTKKKIAVSARVRIIAKIKRNELIRAEDFTTIVAMDRWLIHEPGKQLAEIGRLTQEAFEQVFRQRLRTDSYLKHRIGGIRWEVDVIHYSYKDAI
jgi:methionine aminopeptidase